MDLDPQEPGQGERLPEKGANRGEGCAKGGETSGWDVSTGVRCA